MDILGLDSATLPELIDAYGDAVAVSADPQRAGALMHRIGRAKMREETVEALLTSAEHSIGVPCLAAERDLLQWLAVDLIETRKRLHDIEREIQRRVEHTPTLRRMSEVVGKVSAAVLMAALGSPQNYADTSSYTKASGLNLKERSIGKHKGQLKITKRGPSVVRFYLYFRPPGNA